MRVSKENYELETQLNCVKLLEPKWYRKINYFCDNCEYRIRDEPIWRYQAYYDIHGDPFKKRLFICMTCAKEPFQVVQLKRKLWK